MSSTLRIVLASCLFALVGCGDDEPADDDQDEQVAAAPAPTQELKPQFLGTNLAAK